MNTNLTPHLFWVTSRAAGFVALILASLAVSLGLLMSTKLLKKRGVDLRVTHEILSLSVIAAIVVHAVSLLGDQFLNPSLADIAIPFVSGYQTVWTTLGIVAGWAMIVLGLSYYARRKIGTQRWRKLHRFTALAWLAGLAHSLGEGTDAGQVWFLAMVAIVAIPALFLLVTRVSGGKSRGGSKSRGVGSREAGSPAVGSRAAEPSASARRAPTAPVDEPPVRVRSGPRVPAGV